MVRSSKILRDSRSSTPVRIGEEGDGVSRGIGGTKRTGFSRRQLSVAALLVVLATMPGCTAYKGLSNTLAYNSTSDSLITGWRDNIWAKRSFNQRAANLPVGAYSGSFRDGYIDGYRAVAQGGSGCQPALPPRKYWGWKYQSPEGQGKVNAWFEGYTYGAQAADEEGLGNYRQIQLSGRFEQQVELHGLGANANGCPDCGPPAPGSPFPPGNYETIESGEPMPLQGSIIRPSRPIAAPAMPPPANGSHAVRPVSFEVERLPPTTASR